MLISKHRLSTFCCRLAGALALSPQQQHILVFLSSMSSQDLDHVHPDTDVARMFDRSNRNVEPDALAQRHFLMNLLSAVMQLSADTSILCTHLYRPGQIHHTWPLGSKHRRVGGVHFDCGVQISEDYEMLDAQPPLQDPASVYFVTLISWGAFVLGHMLFQKNHAEMYGPVMSHRHIDDRIPGDTDHAWLSKFMLIRIESCWLGLQYKAGVTADLRSLVLNRAVEELLSAASVSQADRQVFANNEERKAFEVALRDAFYVAYNGRWVPLFINWESACYFDDAAFADNCHLQFVNKISIAHQVDDDQATHKICLRLCMLNATCFVKETSDKRGSRHRSSILA